MSYKAVFFDFDGTLADTRPGIYNSIRYALGEKGIPVGDEEKLGYFLGPPLYDSFSKIYGVDEETANELTDLYRVYYGDKGVFECSLYPDIKELLVLLRDHGVRTAVVSSKPAHFLNVVVPYLGVDTLFDAVVGPELHNKKANKAWLVSEAMRRLDVPADHTVAMLGDRRFDMIGAVEAGAAAVGILYGYGSEEELREAGAQYLAESVEDLHKLLL